MKRVGVRVGISESPPILIIGQIGDFIHKLMYFPPLQPPLVRTTISLQSNVTVNPSHVR